MDSQSPEDGAAKRRRTRAGCLTCRKARVKCPDGRPICHRCGRLALHCRYPAEKQAARPQRRLIPAPIIYVPTPTALQPTGTSMTSQDVSYFGHFQNTVAHQLGVLISPDFWFRTVMRQAMQDQCALDCLVGIGALALARQQCPATIPLYKVRFSNNELLYSLYRSAVRSYAKALANFQRAIASGKTSPRTILINTILLSLFEIQQGNFAAADIITANALRIRQAFFRQDAKHTQTIAPLDDTGFVLGELSLARYAAGKRSMWPMYPVSVEDAHRELLGYQVIVPKPNQKGEDFMEFWLHINTKVAYWISKVPHLNPLDAEVAQREAILEEQSRLLSQIMRGQVATRKRLDVETDQLMKGMLAFSLAEAKSSAIAVECCVDATGAMWDKHKSALLQWFTLIESVISGLADPLVSQGVYTFSDFRTLAISFSSNKPSASVQRLVINDGMLLHILLILRECRDAAVRAGARKICKLLVSQQTEWSIPGWDMKSIFLGVSGLVELEETESAGTTVPLSSRYDWIYGAWSDDFTELDATYQAKFAAGNGCRDKKNKKLRVADYNL